VPNLRGGDRSMLIALEPVPDPPGSRSGVRLRSSQINGTKGLLGVLPMFAASSPFVLVGRRTGFGVGIPKDEPASPEALLAAAASLGAGGAVIVCPVPSGANGEPDYTCELAAEAVQREAYLSLTELPRATTRAARMNRFSRSLVAGLVADERTRESEVSFLSFDEANQAAIVRRRPATNDPVPAASAAPSASAKRGKPAPPARLRPAGTPTP
jgi:hypothetical protein